MGKIAAGLCSILFLFFLTARCPVACGMEIRPGVGIGNIMVGDDVQAVIGKMKKKPSDGKTVKVGVTKEYWLHYKDEGVTYIFNEDRKLSRIATSSPNNQVKEGKAGISVNNTSKDLDNIYGPGLNNKINEKYEQRVYKDKGMSFIINRKSQKIESITIEK